MKTLVAVVSILWVGPILAAQAAEFVPATRINPRLSVVITKSTDSRLIYDYTLESLPGGVQEIDQFYLRASTGSAQMDLILSPTGWSGRHVDGNSDLIFWGFVGIGDDPGADISSQLLTPGKKASGYRIVSPLLPSTVTAYIRGNATQNFSEEDDDAPLVPSPLDDSKRLVTLGPSVQQDTTPIAEIERLIILKHESAASGWLGNAKFVRKLDKRLDQAKAALARDKKKLARTRLSQFVHELTKAHDSDRDERGDKHKDAHGKDKDDRHDKKFVNDEAFQLLKINADFIIAKLPSKAKDHDEEDECRRAEGEKDDDHGKKGDDD